jgi:predicted TIM-barrel fold metal-dependent hydrolase
MDLAPTIRRVLDAFGARRLMWASDCPYQVQEATYEDGIALIRDRLGFLSSEDREWILGRTAERFFYT